MKRRFTQSLSSGGVIAVWEVQPRGDQLYTSGSLKIHFYGSDAVYRALPVAAVPALQAAISLMKKTPSNTRFHSLFVSR
jgi:hypothetical protein